MTWAELPAKLKIYISSLSVLALPILLWASWAVFSIQYDYLWVILTGFTLLTVLGFQLFPSRSVTISIGDAYIMAIAMMFGTAPCIIATFCHTVLISIFARRPRIPLYRIIFNTSSMICGAWIYGNIYHSVYNGSGEIADILLPAALMVTTYFLVNSLFTSIAIAWSIGEKVASFWVKICVPMAIDFWFNAATATFIVAIGQIHWVWPLASIPLIFILYLYTKAVKARAIEAEKHLKEQEQLYLRTVESLALAVDAKDQTTYGHIRRVRVYATGMAHLCGIKDPDELRAIETGSLLHDIGKLAIDDYILNKPGKLSRQEFEKVKMHSAAGDEILKQIRFPFPVAKYVRYHHERYDGTGYPDGLKGEEIPLGARILAIADAFDAIRYSRPYKLPVSTSEAVEILRDQSGTAYDPTLVQLFVSHVDELERQAKIASENIAELSFRKYFENVDRDLLTADVSLSNFSPSQDIPTELLQVAEFCSTAIGHFELQDFLPILARRIERMISFSTCVFYLDDGNGSVTTAHVCGILSDKLREHRIGMGKGISGWVTAHRRSMMHADPKLDFSGLEGDFSTFTDALAVPILFDDEALGTITLYAQKPISYKQKDMGVLQTLADALSPMVAEAKKRAGEKPEDVIDPTTQIHRISYLTAIGPQLISVAAKNRSPVCLIYLEIRNLYQIMRIYGGNVGNDLLKKIARCIASELRESDILVRYGHQGFVTLLPGVRIEHARRCVLRLKQHIRGEVSTVGGQNFSIDCTAGIASYPKDGSSIFTLLQSAQDSQKINILESTFPDRNVVDFHPRA